MMMNPSVKFWDKIAERYAKSPIADEAAYRKKLQITQDYFRPDMEVLEFGCGTGSTAIIHAPHVKHIHAIDASPNMIAIAKNKAEAEAIGNLTFEQASIEDFSAPDKTFDAVLGLSILHLLENKEAAIAKVYNMLKPGGLFVTSTVCLGDSLLKYLKLVVPIGKRLGLMPDVWVFTASDLERSLIDAGFSIDYRWRPANTKGAFKAVFIVAKKVE